MLLMFLHPSVVSGKRTYLINENQMSQLSESDHKEHWNIYIDEIMYHMDFLGNIDNTLRGSLFIVRGAMQWCQLSVTATSRSVFAKNISQWAPCGSVIKKVPLSSFVKTDDVITIQVSDEFHINLTLYEVNIESKVHRPLRWKRHSTCKYIKVLLLTVI